jgi:hypothetical protein
VEQAHAELAIAIRFRRRQSDWIHVISSQNIPTVSRLEFGL